MKQFTALFTLLLAACTGHNYESFSGLAIGTSYSISVRKPTAGIQKKIDSTLQEIDSTFSVFNPQSLTSRVNRNETTEVTPLFAQCFELSKSVHAASDGWFDPTVGPLVDAWGFGAGTAQASPNVDSLLDFVGMGKIRLNGNHIIKDDPRVMLNFSSIAKGLAVDRLAEMLDAEGATDYMVEVGGEVRVRGVNSRGQAWRIGIDQPSAGLDRSTQTVVALQNSIATSGNYRNYTVDSLGRTRVHTIDPRSGEPRIGEILSASIVAPTCALADAWATAVMACGDIAAAQRLLAGVPELEYYIIVGSTGESLEGKIESVVSSPKFPIAAKN